MSEVTTEYSNLSYFGKLREDLRYFKCVINSPAEDAHALKLARDRRVPLVPPDEKGFCWLVRQNGGTNVEIAKLREALMSRVEIGGEGIVGATASKSAIERIVEECRTDEPDLYVWLRVWEDATLSGSQNYPWYSGIEKALRLYFRGMDYAIGRLVDSTFVFGRLAEEALIDYPNISDGIIIRSVATVRNFGARIAHLTTTGAIRYSMMRDVKATDDFFTHDDDAEESEDERDSIKDISKAYQFPLPSEIVEKPLALRRFLDSVQISYGASSHLRDVLGYSAYGAVLATATRTESLFHQLQQQYGDEIVWWMGASVLVGSMVVNAISQAVALKTSGTCHSYVATGAYIIGESSARSALDRFRGWRSSRSSSEEASTIEALNQSAVEVPEEPEIVEKVVKVNDRLSKLTNEGLEVVGLLGVGVGEAVRDLYVSMLPPFVLLYSSGGLVTQVSYMIAMAVDNLTFAGINTVISSKKLKSLVVNASLAIKKVLRPYEGNE